MVVCANALNPNRSAWDRSVTSSKYVAEATSRGLTIDTCRQLTEIPIADEAHPSFFLAGVFFMTGLESPDYVRVLPNTSLPDVTDVADVRQTYVPPASRAVTAFYKFYVNKGEPCTIYSWMLSPPYGAERLDFQKLPSPRAMRVEYQRAVMDLPLNVWCESKSEIDSQNKIRSIPGTTTCWSQKTIGGTNLYRQLKALDYIRANFCAGQAEPPPPPPPKPY